MAEEEEFSGVLCTLEDNLSFPLQAEALGEQVAVIGLDDQRSSLRKGIAARARKGERVYSVGLTALYFIASGEAVLFGTRSFWKGMDIPGEALSLVILDKSPFLPHNDPVLQRQEQLIATRGGDPFEELQVSHAALTLRQGAGRLIRTETDRGVIALPDARINTNTNYGPKIIHTLPGGRQTMRIESVQAFLSDVSGHDIC